MPNGINSKLVRAEAFASRKRGYQSSGVAILRPSASVTTRSLAVNATEMGRKSPTSISKVLMPFAFEDGVLRFQMEDNSADFMGRKSRIGGDSQIMKPELGFKISGANVNMWRLSAFVRIKESTVWSPAKDRRHSTPFAPTTTAST